MLMVEEFQPVCPMAGDCIGKSLRHLVEDIIHWISLNLSPIHLEIGIEGPKPERDSDAGIHHVKKEHQGVGLGVEKSPYGMGESLLQRELLGRSEGMTVDTEGLVHQEETNHKSRSWRKLNGIQIIYCWHKVSPVSMRCVLSGLLLDLLVDGNMLRQLQ